MDIEHQFNAYCFLAIFLELFAIFTTWKYVRSFQNRWKEEINRKLIVSQDLKNFSVWHIIVAFFFGNLAIDIAIGLCIHRFGIL